MRVRNLHCHQPVLIEGRQETFLTSMSGVQGKPQVEIEILHKLGVVEVKSMPSCDPKKASHLLISFANIRFIELWTTAADEYLSERDKNNNVNSKIPLQDIGIKNV